MLSEFVGPVDANSAMVLVAAFFSFGVVAAVFIIATFHKKGRRQIDCEFVLAKLKQEAESSGRIFALETERAYKFKQLESGLITSHERKA